MCEIWSKLTIKTPEQRCFGVFIVNFEQILYTVLVFPLLHLPVMRDGVEYLMTLYEQIGFILKLNNKLKRGGGGTRN